MPQWLKCVPRCGARTRQRTACKQPAMPNGRCRMHGGLSTGPKHPYITTGNWTKSAIKRRKEVRDLIRQVRELEKQILADI